MPPHNQPEPLRQQFPLAQTSAAQAVRFNPDARYFRAYALGDTRLLGTLDADTLEAATAEATERWYWDRGDRLGIREFGQEDAPVWPFQKRPLDRMHIYAVRRSAPVGWRPVNHGSRTEPVYRFKLEHICTVDLKALSSNNPTREAGTAQQAPADIR